MQDSTIAVRPSRTSREIIRKVLNYHSQPPPEIVIDMEQNIQELESIQEHVHIKSIHHSRTLLQELLVVWSERSKKYKECHLQIAQRLERYANLISNITIILSSVSAILGSVQELTCPTWKTYTIHYTINAMSIFVGGLAAIEKMYRFTERSQAHFSSSIHFNKFHRKLNVELLTLSETADLENLVERCRIEHDYLTELSPQIEMEVEKLLRKKETSSKRPSDSLPNRSRFISDF